MNELGSKIKFLTSNTIEDINTYLKNLDDKDLHTEIDSYKVIFILSNNLFIINKLALVFSDIKDNTCVPLIISKILSGKIGMNAGTLIYSLIDLDYSNFKSVLIEIKNKLNLSYEMESMLNMLDLE